MMIFQYRQIAAEYDGCVNAVLTAQEYACLNFSSECDHRLSRLNLVPFLAARNRYTK